MTKERKAEVNRRLAKFDGVDPRVLAYAQEHPTVSDSVMPDYTADLNALARLEAKLPTHEWILIRAKGGVAAHMFKRIPTREMTSMCEAPTEAEARAEAICQYIDFHAAAIGSR